VEAHQVKQFIILAGDFNCPNINWEQQTATGPDREIQQELADLMSFHNLTQVHNQPDRSLCIVFQSAFL
jgi:hypothetical protein